MKTHTGIYFGLLALILSACYDDKGNYTYSDINEMTLAFSPENESSTENSYIFSMPQEDTLEFVLSANITQTQQTDDSNVEYLWRVSYDNVVDSVHTKTCTFKFPPQKTKTYSVLVVVKDRTTGIEVYQNLLVKTVVPFLRSWMVLHGQAGDRKIAALEYDATHEHVQRVVPDIYEMMQGGRRFQNAFSITYSSIYDRDMTKGDKMFVLEPDSCFWVYPFTCEVKGRTEDMMPVAPSYTFSDCVVALPGSKFAIVAGDGQLYHSGMVGYFYNALKSEGLGNYHVDKMYISNASLCITLWDNQQKRLMYYNISNNYYPWDGSHQSDEDFSAQIMLFPESAVQNLDLQHKEVAWMGRGITAMSDEGVSVLLKNTTTQAYELLNVNYGGGGGKAKGKDDEEGEFVTTEVVTLDNPDFNDASVFASSVAFSDQLFYSLGEEVYLYNIITGESTFLHSVGAGKKITAMAFQVENRGTMDLYNADKYLGIAVETPDGKGEFHVVYLNESGDAEHADTFDGFGPIVDFCFTYLEHRGYDLL